MLELGATVSFAEIPPQVDPVVSHGAHYSVNDCDVSPSLRHIAVASDDDDGAIWDLRSGRKIQAISHPGGVRSIAYGAADDLFTTCDDGKLRKWSAKTGKQLFCVDLGYQNGTVPFCGSLSVAGNRLLVGYQIRDAATGKLEVTLSGSHNGYTSLSQNGARAAIGCRDGFARVFDAQTGDMLHEFRIDDRDSFTSSPHVSLSPSGQNLVTGHFLKNTQVWSIRAGREIQQFPNSETQGAVAFVDEDTVLLARHGNWRLYSIVSGKLQYNLKCNDVPDHVRPRQDYLAIPGHPQAFAINWKNGQKIFEAPNFEVLDSVDMSNDGQFVLVSGMLFDRQTGAPVMFKRGAREMDDNAIRFLRVVGDDFINLDGIEVFDRALGRSIYTRMFRTVRCDRRGVALSDDGSSVALKTDDRVLKAIQLDTGKELFRGNHDGYYNTPLPVTMTRALAKTKFPISFSSERNSATIEPGKRRIAAVNGAFHIVGTASNSGELAGVIYVFAKTGDWLVVTPDGFFDGSENGISLLRYRMPGVHYSAPLDRFRDHFEVPGLLTKLLNGESVEREAVLTLEPPPKVRITRCVVQNTSSAEIHAKAELRGEAALTKFRLMVNGRPHAVDQGDYLLTDADLAPDGSATASWHIRLPLGTHSFSVNAYTDVAFGVSESKELTFKRVSGPKIELPKLYVLAVGISDYKNSLVSPLDYAANDARAIVEAFKTHSNALHSGIQTRIITGQEATRLEILKQLQWLRTSATQNDYAVFFFAGHGDKDSRGVTYFLPWDTDPELLGATAIRHDALFQDLRDVTARQFTVVLDSCHSGAIGPSKGNRRSGLRLHDQLIKDLTSEETGISVICAARDGQDAAELHEFRRGAMTQAFIEALSGKAPVDTTGAVYFSQLNAYVTNRVKELTDGYQTPITKVPEARSDFPISKP